LIRDQVWINVGTYGL